MLSTPKSRGEFFLASSLRDGLEDNDIKQVETLLTSKEADPNVLIPTHGISPFHLVIGNESETFAEEVTKLFLRHGGNPNVRSMDGMTPVHVAAAWGRVRVLELLLANGGDPLLLDDDGRSPFHYAFDGAYYNAVAMLGKYCGMSQDEEDDEPKYKLTLDKILINKGDVVAEFVPSECSYLNSVTSETSQSTQECNDEYEQKTLQEPTVNPVPDMDMINNDSNWSPANNVTLRRYQKNRKVGEKGEKVDNDKSGQLSMEEEKVLIGQIIDELSSTFANNETVVRKTMNNDVPKSFTGLKKPSKFTPLLKHRCSEIKPKEITHRRLVDTSIISKSPNCCISVANKKTPLRTPPNKDQRFGLQSHSCRKRYSRNATTPPLRSSNSSRVRIKSASSTPKKKQYISRLYKTPELSKKIEKPNNVVAIENKDNKTPTVFDKMYHKDKLKINVASPDMELNPRSFDRKYGAQRIAIKLDDCMYDEKTDNEHYCDIVPPPRLRYKKPDISSPSTRAPRKPVRIYNDIKKEIKYGNKGNRNCYNTAESKSTIPSLQNVSSVKEKLKPVTTTLKQEGLKGQANAEKNLDFQNDEEKTKLSIFESPGSSNPISSCQKLTLDYSKDDEETKILLEIQEAYEKRCGTPPASVSMLDTHDSSSSTLNSSLEDVISTAKLYSAYNSNCDSSSTYEFQEVATNIHEASSIPASWSCSESFVSVEQEYTYEDTEEGVAFTERHLCVIPSSTNSDIKRANEQDSWIDRLDKLSISSSDTCSSKVFSGATIPDDKTLRDRLTAFGEMPGPITKTTFNVYLKRLWRLERAQKNIVKANVVPSPHGTYETQLRQIMVLDKIPKFLLPTDWTTKHQVYQKLEDQAFKEYATANPHRKYRGGISKTSFCYLLLDPAITRDLPRCGFQLTLEERWKRFLEGIFYVGKGKAARPAAHLYDAYRVWSQGQGIVGDISRKIRRILDIWQHGQGVVCVNVFSHTMMEEACSREAAIIDALETTHLTNCIRGTYYGYATTMTPQEKRLLGKYLLYKSMEIFMHEGERQLFPRNVIM